MIHLGIGNGHLNVHPRFLPMYFLLLKLARFRIFDTAPLYGNGRSEQILGKYTSSTDRIITKIGLSKEIATNSKSSYRWGEIYAPDTLEEFLRESLLRLNRDSCFGVLLHCPSEDWDFSDHLQALEELKRIGLVEKIGISVDAFSPIINSEIMLDIVEAPAEILPKIKIRSGLTVVVNSIFRSRGNLRKCMATVREYPESTYIFLNGSSRIRRILLFRIRMLPLQIRVFRKSTVPKV